MSGTPGLKTRSIRVEACQVPHPALPHFDSTITLFPQRCRYYLPEGYPDELARGGVSEPAPGQPRSGYEATASMDLETGNFINHLDCESFGADVGGAARIPPMMEPYGVQINAINAAFGLTDGSALISVYYRVHGGSEPDAGQSVEEWEQVRYNSYPQIGEVAREDVVRAQAARSLLTRPSGGELVSFPA